ncbi:ABC-F family ATP-binding cassette domain-containing protein [Lapidilactobacillus achengensis]|uniref:ABC-F family ATP-binding cassette domain-containing protein n=1 Tax=Lapidilactobacillus achengensis TaxID=2486000 RepID=A0ABW1ULH5_9LACO|nr:ABC-F family ATP-binding cassette domain-containing protein [Lapidilactobacillus achengensis]
MIILQAQQVARFFGAETLFSGVNLEVQDQGRVGLVGVNGSGKSTLLKIIAGIDPPDEGQVVKNKGLTIGYLAQNSGLDSHNTIIAEMTAVFAALQAMERQLRQLELDLAQHPTDQELLNQYDQLQNRFKLENGYGYEAEIKTVLQGFQFPAETYQKPISSLSGGERSRLALAKILLQRPNLLILDEPTNHLDIETLNWLENYLQSYRGALLIVSHDQYFLDHVTKEIFALEHHSLTHYHGNYSAYLQQRAQNFQTATKAYDQQQAEIKKLETFVEKNITRASTTKRAQARRKQLEKMVRLDKPVDSNQSLHFHFDLTKETGKEVLFVRDLAIGYEDRVMSSPINFAVIKHQRVAIIGPNGVGKSTLVKTLLQQIPALAGSFKFGANVQIGYYDQDQRQLDPQLTVLETIWQEHPLLPEQEIRTVLGSFLFSGDDVQKVVHQLSGGEKARLLLTKLAMEKRNVLLMDEPTNHLDIQSKEVLEQALANFAGTLIFVSHDRYLINSLADRIVDLTPTGSQVYEGNYDFYLEKRQPEIAAVTTTTEISDNQAQFIADKAQQREVRKLERAVSNAEALMNERHQQAEALQQQMAQPAIQADFVKLGDLQKELDQIQAAETAAENDWLLATEALEQGPATN